MLAILGSRNDEIRQLKEHLMADPEQTCAGIDYYPGVIDGTSVVLADIGADPIRAAAATQIALDRFDADEIISIGPAHPLVPYLQEGDLVIGERLWQFDPDRAGRTDEAVDIIDDDSTISSDYVLIRRMEDAYKSLYAGQSSRPQLISGTIVSDNRRSFGKKTMGLLHRRFGAVALDRIGAAMADVCCINDVSLVVLRTVTEISPQMKTAERTPNFTTRLDHAVNLIREGLSTKSPATVMQTPF
jgi:adenosylhomocysteine nucleosidase